MRNRQVDELLNSLGFETDVMEWVVHRLSSGEKQRLAIARLLANHPRALLLDEPTANLDSANSSRAESLLLEDCRAGTFPVVWISHDEDQLGRVADSRFVMQSTGLLTEGAGNT